MIHGSRNAARDRFVFVELGEVVIILDGRVPE